MIAKLNLFAAFFFVAKPIVEGDFAMGLCFLCAVFWIESLLTIVRIRGVCMKSLQVVIGLVDEPLGVWVELGPSNSDRVVLSRA